MSQSTYTTASPLCPASGMVKATLSSTYADRGALDLLNQPLEHGRTPLVQIASSRSNELEGSHV